MKKFLSKIVGNKRIQLFVGIILLLSTLGETFYLSVEHGQALLAIWLIIDSTPNLLQSFERIWKGVKKVKYILILLGILLTVAVLLSVVGCGVATIGAGLTTIEVAGEIAQKVDDLHTAGVDDKVAKEVRAALDEAHAIIDKHHKEHVRDTQ